MLKILLHALNRKGLFDEGFSADDVCPTADPAFISLFGINLSDPPGIPIAGRAHENFWMQVAELEFFYTSQGFRSVVGRLSHDFGNHPGRLLSLAGHAFLATVSAIIRDLGNFPIAKGKF